MEALCILAVWEGAIVASGQNQCRMLLLLRKIVLYTPYVLIQYTLHSTQVKLAHSCTVVHGTHYAQPDAHKTEVPPTTVVNRWYVVQVQGRAREGTAR